MRFSLKLDVIPATSKETLPHQQKVTQETSA